MKLSGVSIFWRIYEKNFNSDLIRVVVFVLESKGLECDVTQDDMQRRYLA